ncbi:MAG: squalene/phytoene synthase family protein [Planctomycetaceae bacterium]|nr:squalene/phytoene synthase family protein [Planctomycetaceae bacterium]
MRGEHRDESVRKDRDELVRSYRLCRRLAHAANSTFARMFWLLPHDQRRAMEALYAFARHTDDLADGVEEVEVKRQRLVAWREELESSLVRQSEIRNPKSEIASVLPALADTARRFDIPRDYLRQVVAGVQMDLDHAGFATFDDLRHYCVHVASAVGLACLAIWGCRDERAIAPATDCGVAFQLTNILRDLAEDAARGRMYLPRADLARFECGELVAGQPPPRPWIELIKFESIRAVKLYDASAATSQFLAGSGRRMFRMMHATYRALLAMIEREPAAVLSHRLRVSRPHKAWIVLRTMVT